MHACLLVRMPAGVPARRCAGVRACRRAGVCYQSMRARETSETTRNRQRWAASWETAGGTGVTTTVAQHTYKNWRLDDDGQSHINSTSLLNISHASTIIRPNTKIILIKILEAWCGAPSTRTSAGPSASASVHVLSGLAGSTGSIS